MTIASCRVLVGGSEGVPEVVLRDLAAEDSAGEREGVNMTTTSLTRRSSRSDPKRWRIFATPSVIEDHTETKLEPEYDDDGVDAGEWQACNSAIVTVRWLTDPAREDV